VNFHRHVYSATTQVRKQKKLDDKLRLEKRIMALEARAIKRYLQGSPRKLRLVADLVRGKSVEEALNILHFCPKHASKVCEMTLRSAVANLMSDDEGARLDPEQMYVKTVTVDGGPAAKRILPAPMGRAFRVRKRTSHLTVIVSEREG
jgi:large subunit ribosomal protein L22